MIYSIVCCIIYILLTVAMILLVHKIIELEKPEKELPVLYIGSEDDAESIEVKLRMMMLEYPSSEIYISEDGASGEASAIAEKMCKDYPQLHMQKTADE